MSLDSVVYKFWEGLSPETIASDCFPVLSLDQVYGAIAFYLSRLEEIDACFKQEEFEREQLCEETNDPEFSKKLKDACRQMHFISS